jgi:hypothetical protein
MIPTRAKRDNVRNPFTAPRTRIDAPARTTLPDAPMKPDSG